MTVKLARLTPEALLVTVVALGSLASTGLIHYRTLRTNASAAAVVAELQAVARAAVAYQANTGAWPPDAEHGQFPEGLREFLPAIRFSSGVRTLEWDKFGLAASGSGYLAGITLRTADRRLLRRVIGEMQGEYPYFVAGGLVTWVLPEGLDSGAPERPLSAGNASGE